MAVIPMLAYEDGAAAIDWLTSAFGFSEQTRFTDDDGTVTHAGAGDGIRDDHARDARRPTT